MAVFASGKPRLSITFGFFSRIEMNNFYGFVVMLYVRGTVWDPQISTVGNAAGNFPKFGKVLPGSGKVRCV